jgi:anti-sigma factor RsiW
MTVDLDCATARLLLLEDQRGRLDPATASALGAHLGRCLDCAHEEKAERLLTELLDRHLPQRAAPLGLKRRLAAQWSLSPSAPPRRSARWPRRGLAVAAAVLLAIAVAAGVSGWLVRVDPTDRLVTEAVNDHLRVLARGSDLDIRSGDMHQVRPWLTARLDFAPVIPFAGDAEFPLRGGTVEYFLDRRAAVAVYGRRLHTVTLIVAREGGLPWPEASPLATNARGFNVRLWKRGGLGYALVSDLDPSELARLAAHLGEGGRVRERGADGSATYVGGPSRTGRTSTVLVRARGTRSAMAMASSSPLTSTSM